MKPETKGGPFRGIIDACADCDTCRYLMTGSCLFFPELYRLYDREKEDGRPADKEEIGRLSGLCTLCGLCPCPNIRADLIRSKAESVRRDGMALRNRLLADIQRVGCWGSLAPEAFNGALSFAPVNRLAKKIVGIHPHRFLPRVARENFFAWARKRGLDREPRGRPGVAYFAGCTAGYFFPEVARSAVSLLERSGVSVYVPPQQCCGMPTLLEGDAKTTLQRAKFNLESLMTAVRSGYRPVSSCPTCSYLMRIMLKENACFSSAYQQSVSAGRDEIVVPDPGATDGVVRLKKSIYRSILKDDGYFSSFDPLERIALSDTMMDLGEYLEGLFGKVHPGSRMDRLNVRMVYFAPCHQREQGIGSPYVKLLAMIPGLTIQPVGGAMDCCGMGGSLGLKTEFHDASLTLGAPLFNKIKAADPELIVTDCLSCRLQFQQVLPYPVRHPLEILAGADENQPMYSIPRHHSPGPTTISRGE
ncbi:MAG: heterodisulfide reductase-related iron-sulfur binding cluster [Thermodesulfobacteriota bacterium]